MEFGLILLAGLLMGFYGGYLFKRSAKKDDCLGSLLIDISDPDEKTFFVTLDHGNLQRVPRDGGSVHLRVKEIDLSKHEHYQNNNPYNRTL